MSSSGNGGVLDDAPPGYRRRPCRICFVCTANMCRSAMAHAALAALAPGITVVSCGTDAWPGSPATGDALRAVAERGWSLEGHAARADARELFTDTLVLCMTRQHRDTLAQRYPDLAFELLTEAGSGAGDDLGDPVGAGLASYRRTRDRIVAEIEAMLTRWDAAP